MLMRNRIEQRVGIWLLGLTVTYWFDSQSARREGGRESERDGATMPTRGREGDITLVAP